MGSGIDIVPSIPNPLDNPRPPQADGKAGPLADSSAQEPCGRAPERKGWDNVIPENPDALSLPKVDPTTILARHVVWFWTNDDDGKRRWWMGVVWDRPTARNPTLEIQPYNSRDKKKLLRDAAFTLVWWDPKADKEEWRVVKKPHLQPFIMDIPADNVMLTGLEWRPGHKLPDAVVQVVDEFHPNTGEPH
jgi:hypothetical protein